MIRPLREGIVIRPLREGIVIRPLRDEDAPGIVALVAACWAEYPGCVMDLDGENPELRCFASHCAALGGAAWIAEEGGEIVGMIVTAPLGNEEWEIKRLYVAGAHRGAGLAQALLAMSERCAVERGARRLVLWSDTRFDRAHRFYEKQGYVRAGAVRALNDLSRSLEFGYAKPLDATAVERLDGAMPPSTSARAAPETPQYPPPRPPPARSAP